MSRLLQHPLPLLSAPPSLLSLPSSSLCLRPSGWGGRGGSGRGEWEPQSQLAGRLRSRRTEPGIVLAAWQLRGGPECHGSLGGSYFRARLLLAQDVVAGKPNYSGMLCSNVFLLCPTHLRLGTPPYLF